MTQGTQIPVGISACLLGENVRFDGGHKGSLFAAEELAPFVCYEAVCPEMAIGLPAPRPALRLIRESDGRIELCFRQGDSRPLTQKMQAFSAQKVATLSSLCGFIVCAKSPSCGKERVRVYEPDSNNNRKEGTGIFTRQLMAQLPWLPVEDDGRLHDPVLRENFVGRIYALHEFNQICQSDLTRHALISFHTRYKLQFLAHSQPAYRELGPFVAAINQWDSLEDYAAEYRNRFMALLSHPATRQNHTNVLMHVQGYFRHQLTSAQRRELATLIDHYRRSLQPLLAPMTLLKHYISAYPDAWLAEQRYFEPYPEVLRLRYGY